MNDGADHLGFTLDALLKLQSAKAFDKKTSVLQYVIMLIQRNDENCLLFPEDLGHIAEASRLTMDSVQADHAVLRQGLDRTCRVMAELDGEDAGATGGPMATFLDKARQICDDLDALIESVKTKYSNVLAYFGEDPNLPSSEFFSTLSKFVVEFIKERDVLERQRKAELKRSAGAAGSSVRSTALRTGCRLTSRCFRGSPLPAPTLGSVLAAATAAGGGAVSMGAGASASNRGTRSGPLSWLPSKSRTRRSITGRAGSAGVGAEISRARPSARKCASHSTSWQVKPAFGDTIGRTARA
jgi:hypothetical protein